MDKTTIVEYIEESPQNTNRAILNQMLDEFADTNGSGGANWDQNDPAAKDYVKNRTHYKKTETYSIANNFETTYNERHYEGGEVFRYLNPGEFPCNLSMEDKESTSLKVFVNGEPIKVVDYREYANYQKRWYLENNLVIRYLYHVPKGKPSESQFSWSVFLDENFEAVEGQKFNLTVTIDGVIYVPIDEKYMPKSVLEWQQPVDWNCNDVNDPAYIKNRTHYDYWEKGKRIYEYYSMDEQGPGFPYVTFVPEADYIDAPAPWLGKKRFLFNGILIDAYSHFDYIGFEEDEETGRTAAIYEWKHQLNADNTLILTIAESYVSEESEYLTCGYELTLNCRIEGWGGISFYEAELKAKTLDERYLPPSVPRKIDWNISDENRGGFIHNRTHYTYNVKGDGLKYYEYDSEHWYDYDNLPHTQEIQSSLTKEEASGYWLGAEGYWVSLGRRDTSWYRTYFIDAFSDWQLIETKDGVEIYRCSGIGDYGDSAILEVEVASTDTSNVFSVTLKSARTAYGETIYEVGLIKKAYKKIDREYLPDGLAADVDWAITDANSLSYIKNKPFDELPEILGGTVFDETVETTGHLINAPEENWSGWYKVTINDTESQYVKASYSRAELYYTYYSIETPYIHCVCTVRGEGDQYDYYYSMTIKEGTPVPCQVTIERVNQKHEIIPLDEKFLPSSVVKKENLPSQVATSVCGKRGEVNLTWKDFGEQEIPDEHVLYLRTVTSGTRYQGSKLNKKVIYNVEVIDDEYGGIYPIEWTTEDSTYARHSYTLAPGLELIVYQYSYWSYAEFEFDFVKSGTIKTIQARIYEPAWIDYKKLKEEYVPDTIARTSQIDALNWETFGEYYKPGAVLIGFKSDWSEQYYGQHFENLPTTITGIEGTSLENGDVVTINIDIFNGSGGTDYPEIGGTYNVTVDNYEMSVSDYDVTIDITYNPEDNTYYIRERNGVELPENGSIKIVREEIHEFYPLKDEYIPSTIARAPKAVLEDVTEAPTAEQYNALLAILRQAGILAT